MPTTDVGADVAWYRAVLGHRLTERVSAGEGMDTCVFAMLSVCERAHDLGLVPEPASLRGRLHNVAFWLDQREDVRTAADVLRESGTHIEFGPGRHGMGDMDYVYFREPGGLRIELCSGGYRSYEPDLTPVRWTPDQGPTVASANLEMPPSMFEVFPPAS